LIKAVAFWAIALGPQHTRVGGTTERRKFFKEEYVPLKRQQRATCLKNNNMPIFSQM